MRIYKNGRRWITCMTLLVMLGLMSACVNQFATVNQGTAPIQDEEQAVDKDAIVEAAGIAILAGNVNLVSEALPHQSEPLIIDLYGDKDKEVEVSVNGQIVAVSWEEEERYAHGQVMLSQEGVFRLSVQIKDGESMRTVETLPVMMDVESPQLQILLDNEIVSELPAYLDHEATLKWKVSDAFFDPDNSVIADHDQALPIRWEAVENHWEGTYVLKEGVHSLKVCVMDAVKHEQCRMDSVIVDVKQPVVTIEYEPQKTYQEAFPVAFTISDDHAIANDSMVSLTCDGESHPIAIDWQETKQGFKGSFIHSKMGQCSLSFHIKDQAGHTAVYETPSGIQNTFEHDFLLDSIHPQLEMNDIPAMNNQPQAITLYLKDDHLDQNAIHVETTLDDHEINIPFTWENKSDGWLGKALISQDGSYRMRINAKDDAGNILCYKGQCGQIEYAFTIDSQAPKLELSHSGHDYYCNDDTKVTFSAFDPHLAFYQLFVYRDHTIVDTRSGHDSEALSFMLDQEGNYEIVAMAQDHAGNVNQIRDQFIIDCQPPKLEALFNEVPAVNGQVFMSNRDVNLHVSWQDSYLKTAELHVWKNHEEIPLKVDAQSVDLKLAAIQDREDSYEISVLLTDYAGNETKADYSLRMDTYLPTLQFVDDPFQGKARNIAWRPRLQKEDEAFHVSDVILYRNQQLVKDFHWGDTITAEGRYLLTLSVRDEAMNEAALLPPFAFTIDHTPPAIRILEAQRQEELWDHHVSIDSELCLYIQDALSDEVNIHTLFFDGEPLDLSQRRQDEKGMWYYPLQFDREGHVPLQMDVSDEAGNHSVETIVFQVSKQLKQSDVKTVNPKQEPANIPSEHTSYQGVVLSAISITLMFSLWIKKVYAAK